MSVLDDGPAVHIVTQQEMDLFLDTSWSSVCTKKQNAMLYLQEMCEDFWTVMISARRLDLMSSYHSFLR